MARTSIKAAGTAQRAEDPVSDVVLAFLKEAAASARELEQLTGKPQAARLAELAGDIREGHLDIAAGIRDDIVRDLYQARRAATFGARAGRVWTSFCEGPIPMVLVIFGGSVLYMLSIVLGASRH